MGKKRKIISNPQKYGRKFASHPVAIENAKEETQTSNVSLEKIEVKEEKKPTPAKPPVVEKTAEIKKDTPQRRRRKNTASSIKKTKPSDD
tara:strand:- start:209 stop:478 length:270 start_codon:yes stop_codon:yes gene_type:complete